MESGEVRFDAVVVGAGSTGSAAAWMLAKEGMRVALVERRDRDKAGACWVNDIADGLFERAGVPLPEGPELVGGHHPFTLLSQNGDSRIRIERRPSLSVDMRRLVRRLHGLAEDAGVTIIDRCRPLKAGFTGARPTTLYLERSPGARGPRRLRATAGLFVDASGLARSLAGLHPGADSVWPRPGAGDLCSAAQAVYEVADRSGLTSFLERQRITGGGNVTRAGVRGGFSTRMVTVHEGSDTVELLTGASADNGYRSGVEIARRFVRREKWIGRMVFGGAGIIPIRRPFPRLVSPGLALVGDAGCQVFPLHGSGVGNGLVAARMLADSTASGGDPGSIESLWCYQNAFQREIGSVNAANDVLRRFSQGLSEAEVDELTTRGLITPASVRAGLGQEMYLPKVDEMAQLAKKAREAPGLAARFAVQVPAMLGAFALYRVHPPWPESARFGAWSVVADALAGTF